MSNLSSHILDISTGRPAAGVAVHLARYQQGDYQPLASLHTDANGRIGAFTPAALPAGRYRLTAEIGAWFSAAGRETPYVHAQIELQLNEEQHYHLPFLIAPGGWSTYRGS
ncbi:TPA: hydroxyisourate hydrolase [Serratia rubidaea]|nr:hydroxyisourate hydrolase [Serratia rubidaea]HDJ1449291.1 hydroxyisourate hydrolase [Serratia rubidaea]HDJ1461243.1 hydroxyisourate hydrolase [Serratia rubidaea]HDJ2773387.1 hydroxyisourate hydrolase [Serratia rubidaea]